MPRVVVIFLVVLVVNSGQALAQSSVFLEELTWTEVQDALRAGKTTAIVPTGGTEQNGPHMVLGKHNVIVRFTAGEIAKQLGNALVAPVVAYVPEGSIAPASGHMRFAGTITLPEEFFMKILEFAARSLQAHGFRDIVFIGDSGGNQQGQKAVAEALNREWAATPVRVHHIAAYYSANGTDEWLQQQGESTAAIGSHASIPDTSQMLALYPEGIRRDKLNAGRANDGSGVSGDPTHATAAYGKKALELKIATGVREIRAMREASRK